MSSVTALARATIWRAGGSRSRTWCSWRPPGFAARTYEVTTVLDLEPPARQIVALARAVTDDMLRADPAEIAPVADLLAHMMGLTIAFRGAAVKAGSRAQDAAPGRPSLEDGWRGQLPGDCWPWPRPGGPGNGEGLTKVGGGTMPATIAGQAGLNELVIHGWDLARATGQPYRARQGRRRRRVSVARVRSGRTRPARSLRSAVEVRPDVPALDRAVGLHGRDPNWPTQASAPASRGPPSITPARKGSRTQTPTARDPIRIRGLAPRIMAVPISQKPDPGVHPAAASITGGRPVSRHSPGRPSASGGAGRQPRRGPGGGRTAARPLR